MNCIVVDDEPLAREKLKLMVARDTSLTLLGCFGNPVSALEFLAINTVELIFLDIQMSACNGIEFAKKVSPEIMIVFTTAYTEYAIDSYQVNALDYLVKPIHESRFMQAVQKAKDHSDLVHAQKTSYDHVSKADQDYVFLRSQRRYHRVNYADIWYIESMKDYSILHLSGHTLTVGMNIKAVCEMLPPEFFVRISRAYVVNFSKVSSIDHHDVQIGDRQLMIGNAYREKLFELYVHRKK
ncbi:DNA-binding response regulator [Pedobacter sp. KBW06]|uniref:LytR/AlgR family response regulator transcription factor n=1 Tax=Pedobacter sp. KBW06 TaxID=2153359 RepID=UPI000F5AB0B6|nr:LytTR family DNA-binding domain-containing protein [Pedobacter sp. KBW06]RQO69783.1 DNA-binding response regulator [Pedobacter sp. KBW06]